MEKLNPITEKEWEEVCEFNRFIWNDFLTNSTELSPKTKKSYYSNLRIWFVWVKNNLNNKKQIDIKPLEFKKFQNWIVNRGCSSSDVANKRAAISSLNNYIVVYYAEEHPTFHNFINKSISRPAKAMVYQKQPLTKEEFNNLILELEKREKWQQVAYLKFSLDTGCRRAEVRQLRKEVINYKPIKRQKTIIDDNGNEIVKEIVIYQTHDIRAKGRSSVGKVRKMSFGQDTMDYLKKWLDIRGNDDCEYVFVTKYGGKINQVSETTFNGWCKDLFAPIIGHRIFPHLLRSSRATQIVVEEGKDISVAQKLLGHENSSTTAIYVKRDETEDLDELFIDL